MPPAITRRSWIAGAAAAASPAPLRLPRKIRLAFIGLAGHTGEVLNPLKNLPDVEIAAFWDPDPKAAARLARTPAARRGALLRRLAHPARPRAARHGGHLRR